MSRYRVTCTLKHEKHERITSLGCSLNNVFLTLTEAQVIDMIENQHHTFYVERPSLHVVEVEVVTKHDGTKYLKTVPDGQKPDNLLSLPDCPKKPPVVGPVSSSLGSVVGAASHGPECGDEAELINAEVPARPASLIPFYSQFAEILVPAGSGAVRAHRGMIRPFSDDANAKRVLRAIEANQALSVDGGRLDAEVGELQAHALDSYLSDMAQPCTVVVLEYAGTQHPRAFLVDPLPIQRWSANQHLWWDLAIRINGHETPALCVYSGNLFKYDPELDMLTQFLNQVSTYLAKHLIFLRTRMLYTTQKNGLVRRTRWRAASEAINAASLRFSKNFRWLGYWIGPVAPSGAARHVATLNPDDECWCTSGKLYKDCHLPVERPSLRLFA